MKKITKPYAISLLALALAACNNDGMQTDPLADGPVPLSVTADISAVATRVNIADDGKASFTPDDMIHVVASGMYRYPYELQTDRTWSAGNSPYYFQNTTPVNFRAWYAHPTAAMSGNTISINTKVQTDENESSWNKWDILVTPQVTASVSSSTVSFTGDNAFAHIMTRLVFVFKAGTDADINDLSSLTGYKLCSVITDATFNMLSCTLTTGTTTDDIAVNITGTGKEYTAAPLIVVPQTPSGNLSLEVTYSGNTYKASLTPPTGGLQAGYSYTYTVTIKNTALEVSNAEISNWNTSPVFDGNVDATLQ